MRLRIFKWVSIGMLLAGGLSTPALAINWQSGFDTGALPASQITVSCTTWSHNLSCAQQNQQAVDNVLDQLVIPSYGLVMVYHADGSTPFVYNPSSNTDVARGTALENAVGAAVAGDVIRLSANTYDLGTGNIVETVSGGHFDLIGAGKYSTIIKSTHGGSQTVIAMATNSYTANLFIQCVNTTGFCLPIGNNATVITNALAQNIAITGTTDGIYFENGDGSTAYFDNIDANTKWDGVFDFSLGTYYINNSRFTTTADNVFSTTTDALFNDQGGTIYAYNSSFTATNGTAANYAVRQDGGANVFLYGCQTFSSGSGTNYDIEHDLAGIMSVDTATSYRLSNVTGVLTKVGNGWGSSGAISNFIANRTASTGTAAYNLYTASSASSGWSMNMLASDTNLYFTDDTYGYPFMALISNSAENDIVTVNLLGYPTGDGSGAALQVGGATGGDFGSLNGGISNGGPYYDASQSSGNAGNFLISNGGLFGTVWTNTINSDGVDIPFSINTGDSDVTVPGISIYGEYEPELDLTINADTGTFGDPGNFYTGFQISNENGLLYENTGTSSHHYIPNIAAITAWQDDMWLTNRGYGGVGLETNDLGLAGNIGIYVPNGFPGAYIGTNIDDGTSLALQTPSLSVAFGSFIASADGNATLIGNFTGNVSNAGNVFSWLGNNGTPNFISDSSSGITMALNNVLNDGADNATIIGTLSAGELNSDGGSVTTNGFGDLSISTISTTSNADVAGQLRVSKAQPANFPVVWLNGTLFTGGGTGTTTKPYLYLDQGGSEPSTWSTSGTELGINSQLGFVGNFLDFHPDGGASVFSVNSSGNVTAAQLIKSGGTSSQFLKANGSVDSTAYGTGSVTSASVVSANGFAGTVATSTTTPAITLTTTITGLLKGNGTAITAASAVTDYPALPTTQISSAQTTAITVKTITTPNDGNKHYYRVGGWLAITAIVTDVIQFQVTWTDQNGTSRTQIFYPMGATSVGLSSTGYNPFSTIDFYANPNTSITVATVLTTGIGSITYDVGTAINQLT